MSKKKDSIPSINCLFSYFCEHILTFALMIAPGLSQALHRVSAPCCSHLQRHPDNILKPADGPKLIPTSPTQESKTSLSYTRKMSAK